jgi:serine/threonine-protein kinase
LATKLTTGATLGRYQLLVPLGQGGMGSVWVAREESPASGRERLVAIKVMRPEFTAHSNFRALFLEEGQLVRSIEHDNVVQVYEVAEHDGVLWMTMQWVEGESLDTLFKEASKRRPIPAEMAVRIVADTAKGLHAAHELRGWDGELKGVVHRDVSPHNILIGLDGHIKLADFGLANATESSGMPVTEAPHGKYSYMSPEQARGQAVDRTSDIFSLGVVLYELTTGTRLFKGVDRHHTLGLVMQCKVPAPRSLNPAYSPDLEAIVLKALANKPSERFQTADELRVALEKHLVTERTLVSAGSVAALLRRIVGKRLEQRRQLIHEALVSTVGHANPALLPDTTFLTGMSQVSEVTEPGRGMLSHPGSSETPHAVSHSQTAMLPARGRSRRPMMRIALWAGGSAALAFSLMLLVGKLIGGGSDTAAGAGAGQPAIGQDVTRTSGADADDIEETTVEGLRLSDLPVEEQEKEKRRRAKHQAAQRARQAPAPPPASKPAWLQEAAGYGETDDSMAPAETDDSQQEGEAAAKAGAGDTPGKIVTNPYVADETKPKAGAEDEAESGPSDDKPAGLPDVVLEEEAPPAPKPPPAKKPEPYRLRVPGAD